MLLGLKIRDLAVIDSLEISFESGFTVLTGETGAGKSILVDALTLVLGGRASSELIRSQAESAEVEALFDLSGADAARTFLLQSGLLAEARGGESERELVIRRVITHAGKNRVWINGKMESTGRLFELGRFLVDIYGQHEYQTLLQEDRHLSLLDAFAGLGGPLAQYRSAYEEWRRLLAQLAALELDEAQKREREDLLRYRVQEIEAAGLKEGEDAELAAERERLKHADFLAAVLRFGREELYESDDAVVGRLRGLVRKLQEAGTHDPWFRERADEVESAASILEEAAMELSRRGGDIEPDPRRLQWIEDRLEELKRLKRKYGDSLAAVLGRWREAKEELARLAHQEEKLEELTAGAEQAEKRARELARRLTEARQTAGAELARRIVAELAGLGMEKTRFEARVLPAGGEGALGPAGADEVAFYLSPNPGEDLKPLARIASGGELSRIMLGLRAQLLTEGVATLVFDEVDQGISGAVAEAVGKRMKKLAECHQVLCVTHLPQIAALADHHLLVVKHQTKHRTWVEAASLNLPDRVNELGRMLAGQNITDAARLHAREMLALAGHPLETLSALPRKTKKDRPPSGAKPPT